VTRKAVRAAIVAAGAVIVAAPAAMAEDAYLIGMSAGVTGPASGTYAPVAEAIQLYMEQVNAKGGINGHPVEFIVTDNRAEPSRAAADAKQFVNDDKVVLVLNTGLSSTYAPMVAETRRAKMPLMFAGGVCPNEVQPPADPLQFCTTSYAADKDVKFALNFIKESADGPVKLGMVSMAIPLARAAMDQGEGIAKELGMETVDKENIPPPTPNYAPFATKIKSAGANWVFSWSPWVTQVKTFEALRAQGWEGKYLTYGHIESEGELRRLKADAFMVFGAAAFFEDDLPIHREIKAAAEAKGTRHPATLLAEGWVAAMVLEEVLKKVSWPPTRDKVAAAMNNVSVDTKGLRGGPITWTKDNHFRTSMYHRVYRWDSGQNKIVRVKDWVETKIQ